MLREKLRNNKKLIYWWRCFKNRNNKEYESFVFNDTHKLFFEVNNNTNSDDDGPVIYDIDISGNRSGFFAIYRWLLHGLYVANRFKMIPHIRVMDTFYTEENEDFFKTYFELKNGLSNINDQPNVVKYYRGHYYWFDDKHDIKIGTNGYNVDDNYINDLAKIKNKYLSFNSELTLKIEKEIEMLLSKDETIGVHYRGTDYKAGFIGHPVGLSPSDYFDYIDDLLKKGYSRIFVATDDYKGLEEFADRYKEKVVYYLDTQRSIDGKSVHEFSNNRENDAHLKGYEVLRDMLTLARCDSLICGKSQVSIASRIERSSIGKKYEYFKLIDKGDYKKDKRKQYYKKFNDANE